MAASTHRGEEADVLYAHEQLKKKMPRLLTIVVPRHPQRGDEVEKLFKKAKIKINRRSFGEKITSQTDVYLADTIGELGLFYKLCAVAFVGGSLVTFGGQNVLEPARMGKAVITGPHTHNFKEIVERAVEARALDVVKDKKELTEALGTLLQSPKALKKAQEAAADFARSEMSVLDRLTEAMAPYLALEDNESSKKTSDIQTKEK